jgi:hypothetical protein
MPSLAALRLDALPQAVADSLAQCCLYKTIDDRTPDRREVVDAARTLASGFWRGAEATRPMMALLLSRWLIEVGGDPEESQSWAALAEGGIVDQAAEVAALRALIAWRHDDTLEAHRQLTQAIALRHRVHKGAALILFDDDVATLQAQMNDPLRQSGH